MTVAELDAFHARTAQIDPGFARREREFYESRTASQLSALAYQAWLCNDAHGYQLARSYKAAKQVQCAA